jgi:hypothetical protein
MNKVIVPAIALFAFLCLPDAFAKESQPKTYLQATIVSVDKHEQSSTITGDNPTDAPMPDPETFAYDVAVHVNCGTYVGRYQSWYDYLPSEFTPNRIIKIRLTRGRMYVPLANQKEVEMSIVQKRVERGQCDSTNASASIKH